MQSWLKKIVDNRDPASLSARFRRRRLALFLELASSFPPPVTVLDVGGEQRFWEVMHLAGNPSFRITLLNITPQSVTHANLNSLAGDAADLSRFSDSQFDVAFSNSVIEHLGSVDRQQRMADEMRRIGRSYYVQTPNRRFPLEPHFLLPWYQYYPEWLQVGLLQRFRLGWYPPIPDVQAARQHVRSHHLLSEAELQRLFPGARIEKERVLGMVKSFVVVGQQSK